MTARTSSARARELASRYLERGDPTGWFETLYAEAASGGADVPWACRIPDPNLLTWLSVTGLEGGGRCAAGVGCGLGDDAEALARRGFHVTAFDVSPSAIAWCRERFAGSGVRYVHGDLFDLPSAWAASFDFVLESYTLQALPASVRADAIAAVSGLVAPGGTLLVISRARGKHEPPGEMPWPLTRAEVLSFATEGLALDALETYLDPADPSVRRFRAEFHRPA